MKSFLHGKSYLFTLISTLLVFYIGIVLILEIFLRNSTILNTANLSRTGWAVEYLVGHGWAELGRFFSISD